MRPRLRGRGRGSGGRGWGEKSPHSPAGPGGRPSPDDWIEVWPQLWVSDSVTLRRMRNGGSGAESSLQMLKSQGGGRTWRRAEADTGFRGPRWAQARRSVVPWSGPH